MQLHAFSKIELYLARAKANGPDRVFVRIPHGYSILEPRAARLFFGVVPTILLMRSDGWTLGINENTVDEAKELFQDWLGYIKKPNWNLKEFKK